MRLKCWPNSSTPITGAKRRHAKPLELLIAGGCQVHQVHHHPLGVKVVSFIDAGLVRYHCLMVRIFEEVSKAGTAKATEPALPAEDCMPPSSVVPAYFGVTHVFFEIGLFLSLHAELHSTLCRL